MKTIKALSAIALVLVLALGLFACGFEEEETAPQTEQTPLAVAQADPIAFFNALTGLAAAAEGFTVETNYGMDDIEAGNKALQEARNVIKGYVIDYIKGSARYNKDDRVPADLAKIAPALFNALLAEDLLEDLVVSDVLTLRLNTRLENLEKDIEDNRNTSMKGKTDAEKLEYVKTQMGENEMRRAGALYQIEGKLSLEAAEKLLAPADKAAILAQLAKAEEYLLVEDYVLEPTEFTLFATVNKAFVDTADATGKLATDPAQAQDHIQELSLTLKSNLTAEAQATGGLADAGTFPISLTLRKTVAYKDIVWEAEENA